MRCGSRTRSTDRGGWRTALLRDADLAQGLNVAAGQITCREVAAEHGLPFTPAAAVLA